MIVFCVLQASLAAASQTVLLVMGPTGIAHPGQAGQTEAPFLDDALQQLQGKPQPHVSHVPCWHALCDVNCRWSLHPLST